ncbi:hypothetical protein JWG40_13545 [Leptospira sp. 201903074]|uniref:hypothetical protein n=1 Tax=Leptospira abararensis TaxID=2810036 RepID=UPI001962F156|nr:hypothetical protein [Leptospira abararensis]MBM9548051.1 hypothetical protein [Leptospira abararensis]
MKIVFFRDVQCVWWLMTFLEDLKPQKTRKGTEVREMKIVFSVLFSDFRGLEKEEEINHGKHGKTQKEGR